MPTRKASPDEVLLAAREGKIGGPTRPLQREHEPPAGPPIRTGLGDPWFDLARR